MPASYPLGLALRFNLKAIPSEYGLSARCFDSEAGSSSKAARVLNHVPRFWVSPSLPVGA